MRILFDWEERSKRYQEWEKLSQMIFNSKRLLSRCVYSQMKDLNNSLYPIPFEKELLSLSSDSDLIKTGFAKTKRTLTSIQCQKIINLRRKTSSFLNIGMLNFLYTEKILEIIIREIYEHTRIKHLIWSCSVQSKSNDSKAYSDHWHYDNHYNNWTPKAIIYLNGQLHSQGATHVCSSKASIAISASSDYLGMAWQRKNYKGIVRELKDIINLDQENYDPPHYKFSPEECGEGILFYPSRVLHRAVSPLQGIRYIMMFSFTPISKESSLSIDECTQESCSILKKNINDQKVVFDSNPFWL